jgi:hypothetical protein
MPRFFIQPADTAAHGPHTFTADVLGVCASCGIITRWVRDDGLHICSTECSDSPHRWENHVTRRGGKAAPSLLGG